MPDIKARSTPSVAKDQLSVIATQVDYLVKSFDEMKTQMNEFESRRTTEWIEYKVEHAKVVDDVISIKDDYGHLDGKISKLDVDTRTRCQAMEKSIAELEKAISPLIQSNKILIWIGGILGGSIIIFIWGIITHTITIVAP